MGRNDQQKKRAAFRFRMTGNTEVCGHSFLNCETKEECRMRYIGLDVHKDKITACVLTSTGKPKFEKDFLKESGNWILDELLDFGDKEGFCVMIESGTYAYAPFRFFSDRGIEVHVVHAKALKVITDSDKKTDRKGADNREDAQTMEEGLEVMVFVVNPTRLSALMQLASHSKRTKGPASIAPFGHACQQIYAIPKAEGESDDSRGVIGMTDMYARRYVGTDMMTYAVSYLLYRRMIGDVPGSFLQDEKYLGNLEKALRLSE